MNEIYDVIVLGTGLKVNFSRFAKYGEIWNIAHRHASLARRQLSSSFSVSVRMGAVPQCHSGEKHTADIVPCL